MIATRILRPATAFSKSPIGKQKRPRRENEAHLKWVRTLPCLLTGKRPVEAAHIRYPDPRYGKMETGMGQKSHDHWTVPLSPEKHREQHTQNEREFWLKHGVDPVAVAAALWSSSGDDAVAEIILQEARRQNAQPTD